GIEEIGDADAVTAHLRFIRGTDSASGRADLRRPGGLFARDIEGLVIRKDAVRRVADLEVGIDLHAERAKALDLVEQRLRIDDHPVAEDAELVRVQDPRGDQLQRIVLLTEADRVPRVVAALIARHDVEALAQEVDDFSLSLVTPLRADDREILSLPRHERTAETNTVIAGPRTPGTAEGPSISLGSRCAGSRVLDDEKCIETSMLLCVYHNKRSPE